ncbi:MAG: type I restriction endonuclease [Candidatus Bathyarchaeota archaeon]|nr:type I restriction endonuclease [Candidatus Bathyarchaeota archaeon]
MPTDHKEVAFESAIEDYLVNKASYSICNKKEFDQTRGIFPNLVLSFIQSTQNDEWNYLVNILNDKAGDTLLDNLCRALDSDYEGCLNVLRHGFKCYGKKFRMAYFAPASDLNPETLTKYNANILTVTRQLKYSEKHKKTLDLVLSINGIPFATAELKNQLTGQTWINAINQYKNHRDPNELIFHYKKRTLVHFAVDTDEVYMTTKLAGKSTFFLPFNKGVGNGAGNPENPNGYKTSYLWEEVWQKDSILDIISRFIHLEVKEQTLGKINVKKETMIFPRYHQLDTVRKLVDESRSKGTGINYLVQHSTGSGKSLSIAWLSHRLSTLHDDEDNKIFDSVVVVTDRVVLDQQLQNTIYQFEHKRGVVKKIDQDSTQLAQALENGTPIIITTLQKFPYVTEKIGTLPKKTYAVIIDEAHSSQGGESAIELKRVLAGSSILEEASIQAEEQNYFDFEEEILKVMLSRGKQPNINFYAFTATPKYKTLEVFGTPGPYGKPHPFHLYSMRQAIEENFIHDVLQNYTTYETYYRLIKSIEDDPRLDKRKAARALARFVSLHPHNIAQKTEIMIEHFWNFTRHKIGGKAKAMVITSSRLHAVRYKRSFDNYINKKGYAGIKTLVAFSKTVIDPDTPEISYTEVGMNKGIREKELPKRFSSNEYQVLIVAEKYQTGFDQPLLHTMYVDTRLFGLRAVQTLSRLNRIHQGKEDTFILDFVNKAEEIKDAFQPYYEQTTVGEQATPDQLYELQAKLESYTIFYSSEVEEFAKVFYKPIEKQTSIDHAKMNACLDPAVKRFTEMDEKQEEFRKTLAAYRNLYSFLSQVIPFQDTDLEKLYSYIRFLIKKLPQRIGEKYNFGDEVQLEYYRLQKISEGSIVLDKAIETPISGPTSVGTGKDQGPQIMLSNLIDLLNERFGTDFKLGDQLFFDSIKEDALSNPEMQQAARVNTMENFGYVFLKILEGLFIERMEQNEEITAKFLNEDEFRAVISENMLEDVYNELRKQVDEDIKQS